MNEKTFLDKARLWVYKNHKTQTKAAGVLGIDIARLNEQLHGKRPAGKELLDAMGYSLFTDVVITRVYTKRIK